MLSVNMLKISCVILDLSNIWPGQINVVYFRERGQLRDFRDWTANLVSYSISDFMRSSIVSVVLVVYIVVLVRLLSGILWAKFPVHWEKSVSPPHQ